MPASKMRTLAALSPPPVWSWPDRDDGREAAALPVAAGAGGEPLFATVQTVARSTSGHDRLLGTAFDSGNRLYAAGWGPTAPTR